MLQRLLAGAFIVVALIVPAVQLAVPLDADGHAALKDRPDSPRAWRSGLPTTSPLDSPAGALLTYLRVEHPGAVAVVVLDRPFVPPRS